MPAPIATQRLSPEAMQVALELIELDFVCHPTPQSWALYDAAERWVHEAAAQRRLLDLIAEVYTDPERCVQSTCWRLYKLDEVQAWCLAQLGELPDA